MKNTKMDTTASLSKHKVLLFGQKLIGIIGSRLPSTDNADIQFVDFLDDHAYGNLQRLTNYTLVVTDYAPFKYERTYLGQQDVFDKLIAEALDSGTTICLVHYNEAVPRFDKSGYEFMNNQDYTKFNNSQLGFRILNRLSIKPYRHDTPILNTTIRRGVFQPFLSKWGASHNCFTTYGDGKFDDIISDIPNLPVGFAIEEGRGRIIFLPFQRDFARELDLKKGIYTLVDCLLTYITKMHETLPGWATAPFFKDEELLNKDLQRIETELQSKKDEIQPFSVCRQLLCQAEYKLENTVPAFITKHFGIKTEIDENYAEDFWILNDSAERIAICEVKSHVKGCKRSSIYSIFNHRDTNGLGKVFPAILFVNQHMQSASWEAKDRPINKDDYEVAAKDNILVLRIEDLVRFWSAIRNGSVTRDYLLTLLTTSKGWVKVDASLNVTQLPKSS